MQYHPEDFVALSLAVEREGGELLERPCRGEAIKLKQPNAEDKMEWRGFRTTHCDQSALMNLTYDPTNHVRLMDDDEPDVVLIDHAGEPVQYEPQAPGYTGSLNARKEKRHLATVCAVDDALGLWPRFAGVVSERSYQRP